MKDIVISEARIVTPTEVVEHGTLIVSNGRIASIQTGAPDDHADAVKVDGRNRLLLPGLIDLHNDGIEQELEPRPRARFPLAVALQALESRLVSHGITTIFHSFSFMDGREGSLNPEHLEPAIRELTQLRRTGIIRHLVHARYEMVEVQHYERLLRLIDGGHVNLVSFMDHTPGQGQYRNVEYLLSYYARKYNAPASEVKELIAEREKKARNPEIAATLESLAAHVRAAGLPMASHDDDTPEKVARMRALGVGISEFPVEMSAALSATHLALHVAVGAPNVLRGQSTTGNLSALQAIAGGAADILCSDYYTPALLQAVFRLVRDGFMSLPDAVRMASLNPARATGLDGELGSLSVGKRADMILVSDSGTPSVVGAWVGGHRVHEKHDGALDVMGDQWAAEASPRSKEKADAL
jgi:alpha-D-ribose 1-methylphosphonate 5-triphosphate diphosphatase